MTNRLDVEPESTVDVVSSGLRLSASDGYDSLIGENVFAYYDVPNRYVVWTSVNYGYRRGDGDGRYDIDVIILPVYDYFATVPDELFQILEGRRWKK